MLEPKPIESEPYRAPENLGTVKESTMAENSPPSSYKTRQGIGITTLKDV